MAEQRTLAQLAETTQDELLIGIIDTLKKNDEFSALLVSNAMVTDRPTIKLNRLLDAGAVQWADCSTSLNNVAISGAPVSFDLHTIVRQFQVCTIGQDLYSSFNDVVADELAGAVKAISEEVNKQAILGGGSSEIFGLETLAQSISAGASFDLTDVDYLMDTILAKGPNTVIVGAPASVRLVVDKVRSLGGITYDTVASTAFRVPQINGVNLLKSQYVTSGKLIAVNLDEFQLYFGTSAGANVGGLFTLEDLGPSKTKLAKEWRIYAHIAAVLKNPQGIAQMTGVTA